MKIYLFAASYRINKHENILQQIFPGHMAIYSSQLLKTSLLPEVQFLRPNHHLSV